MTVALLLFNIQSSPNHNIQYFVNLSWILIHAQEKMPLHVSWVFVNDYLIEYFYTSDV